MLKIMPSIILAAALLLLAFAAGCTLPSRNPAVPSPPLPTQLAMAGFPPGSEAGGLEGMYISRASIPGAGDERCYKLLRFYLDGLVLYSDLACLADGSDHADLRDEVGEWFNRQNDQVSRGDYARLDGRLWLRVVVHDSVHETEILRSFQGEACGNEMVLREPAVRGYAGIPSDLTEPVQEYTLLAGKLEGQAGVDGCRLPGFHFERRIYITLAGKEAEYIIRTAEGQDCSLVYLAPNGIMWPVGDQAGEALVTVTIGGISQDFEILIR